VGRIAIQVHSTIPLFMCAATAPGWRALFFRRSPARRSLRPAHPLLPLPAPPIPSHPEFCPTPAPKHTLLPRTFPCVPCLQQPATRCRPRCIH
jgi:hypothetical protein